nr:MAG TPA: hypothetical protein [Caudoviricetes sp.]
MSTVSKLYLLIYILESEVISHPPSMVTSVSHH